MPGLFSRFAAESGPSIHVAPSGVFEIAGLTITNSMIYGIVCMLGIIALLTWVARRVTVKPQGGFVQVIEAGVEFVSDMVTKAFDDPKIGRRYVPFFVTIFFFILLNNWFGLIPGVGEAISQGENPVLRPFTADLNGTFAIGIVTMIAVYAASIKESGGVGKYFKHFFIGSIFNPLYLVIGLLEMLTDLTRVFSLSLRLFLNITIGEIVIAVFAFLGSYAGSLTSLPFYMIELFVGALQAYIFTVLSLMYLAIAVNHAGEHHEHAADESAPHLTTESTPETMKLPKGGTA